jgi:segregation and condensation protein B
MVSDMPELSARIEALLFAEGGSLSKKRLAQLLSVSPQELQSGIESLSEARKGSALSIVETELEVTLAVSPRESETVRAAFERELGAEIGDAGLEVLAIILYRGASTRAQLEYIRGVNSSWTIRMLAARGLLERVPNPEDAREYLYRPTVETLAHLGVRSAQELPEYAKISSELAAFERQNSGPFEDHAPNAPSEG